MNDKPIISGRDLSRWNLAMRDYKILALSLVLSFLGFGVLFQTNALNKRGCDTSVGSVVCSALNAVLIAGRIAGTDAGFVDKDYVRTILDDSDLVLIGGLSLEPLRYPEGYFLLANQKELPPVAPSQAKEESRPTAPKTSEKTDSASSLDEAGAIDEVIVGSVSGEDSEPELITDPATGVEINRKVLRDYANYVKAKVDSDSLDLEGAFTIVAEGILNERGRLDTSVDPRTGRPRSRIISSRGDADMREVAKEAIAAVGDSGWLIYLRNQGIEKINFTVMQDGAEVRIRITSDQPTPESARTIASGLRGIIQGALLLDKNNVRKLGADERILLNSAKASVNRRQFVLDFVMSKAVAQEMIKRRLKEMDGGRSKPSGLAESRLLDGRLGE
jgi:hypothetical protein